MLHFVPSCIVYLVTGCLKQTVHVLSVDDVYQSLEDAIRQVFILAQTDFPPPSDNLQLVYVLPTC